MPQSSPDGWFRGQQPSGESRYLDWGLHALVRVHQVDGWWMVGWMEPVDDKLGKCQFLL